MMFSAKCGCMILSAEAPMTVDEYGRVCGPTLLRCLACKLRRIGAGLAKLCR